MVARRPAGFTLLEVLVALALMAVLFGILTGALRLGARTWSAAEASIARTEDIAGAYALMRRLIERAYPMAWGSVDDKNYAFQGEPKVLRFVALLPAYPSVPGPYFVGFVTEPEADGSLLRLTLTPFSTDEDATRYGTPIEDVVIAEGLGDVSFSYFGDHGDGDLRWGEQWDNRATMPSRIRVDLGRDARGAIWPAMVMPLGIELDVACLFSDETPTGKCRQGAQP